MPRCTPPAGAESHHPRSRTLLTLAFLGPLLLLGAPRVRGQEDVTVAPDTSDTEAGDDAREEVALQGVPPECPIGDADGDGICDTVEMVTGTSPYEEDTDGDGVPDGVEDANQDGVVDEGESDPRVPGLFPGTYPYIPEPMVFDLVRALGAKRGELEANTLIVTRFRRGRADVLWAPEIEWAFADNLAIELELPMHNARVEALKAAFQATFPTKPRRFTHGVQVITEYLLTPQETELTVLYLAGVRLNGWSLFAMVGARTVPPMDRPHHTQALLNPSIYYDVNERVTVGVEGNFAISERGLFEGLVVPQVHVQLGRHLRVQFGGGVQVFEGLAYPVLATRIIVE
jgi:hypothetical protein